jgi:hypothetical protein
MVERAREQVKSILLSSWRKGAVGDGSFTVLDSTLIHCQYRERGGSIRAYPLLPAGPSCQLRLSEGQADVKLCEEDQVLLLSSRAVGEIHLNLFEPSTIPDSNGSGLISATNVYFHRTEDLKSRVSRSSCYDSVSGIHSKRKQRTWEEDKCRRLIPAVYPHLAGLLSVCRLGFHDEHKGFCVLRASLNSYILVLVVNDES